MIAATRAPRMTIEEFFVWAAARPEKFELIDGVPVAMAPSKVTHGGIQANMARLIGNGVHGGPCRVVTEAGIRRAQANDTWYVADLAVTCTPQKTDAVYVENPVVLVEVQSPSSEESDRTRKLLDYQELPSVQDVLLVSSDRRFVAHFRKHGEEWLQHNAMGGELKLLGIPVTLALDEIYAGTGL